jgi:hypothetical protein
MEQASTATDAKVAIAFTERAITLISLKQCWMVALAMRAIVAEGFCRTKIVQLLPNQHIIVHSARKSPQFSLVVANL